jgi:hypothetical protein
MSTTPATARNAIPSSVTTAHIFKTQSLPPPPLPPDMIIYAELTYSDVRGLGEAVVKLRPSGRRCADFPKLL